MTENLFQDVVEGFQDMKKATDKFNKELARVILLMPIPLKYESWVFLHSIADGDVE